MIVKKGTLLGINHCRKGGFKGIAKEDFDTETREFYPIVVAPQNFVSGINTEWEQGEEIPCRKNLCKIKILGEEK